MLKKYIFLIFTFLVSVLFSQDLYPQVLTGSPYPSPYEAVAARMENGAFLFYNSLNEAVAASPSAIYDYTLSAENPDVIILFRDTTLHAPIIMEDDQHIRIVAEGGSRTIIRGDDLIEYPLVWVLGDNSSLTLGNSGHELIIDGGYPAIQAHAPLAAVNGRNSQLIMYDRVFLQNNYNIGPGAGTSLHLNGTGVFIRTVENDMDNLAEFVMRGGVIQGNTNNAQNPIACGGGVYIAGFGLFTMEGGVIRNNTAYLSGGGFHTGSRGSFRKTGGIIYGSNAPEGLRNVAINGIGSPPFYGHAICVALVDSPSIQFRDNTVRENDHLSYMGSATGNGIFGRWERWHNPETAMQRIILFGIISSIVLVIIVIILILIRNRQKNENKSSEQISLENLDTDFSMQEKTILDKLLSELSIKMIALELELSYKGVMYHSKKIYQKLKVKNRTELLIKYRK